MDLLDVKIGGELGPSLPQTCLVLPYIAPLAILVGFIGYKSIFLVGKKSTINVRLEAVYSHSPSICEQS